MNASDRVRLRDCALARRGGGHVAYCSLPLPCSLARALARSQMIADVTAKYAAEGTLFNAAWPNPTTPRGAFFHEEEREDGGVLPVTAGVPFVLQIRVTRLCFQVRRR